MMKLSVYQYGKKIIQDESRYYQTIVTSTGAEILINSEEDQFYISPNDTYKIEIIDGKL